MAVAAERKVTVAESTGADGAVVVLIDTEFDPDGCGDGPGLRVVMNDHPVYVGVEFQSPED